MGILDLDDKYNMKNKSVEKNILSIIKEYGKITQSKKKLFNKYDIIYKLDVKYKRELVNMDIKITDNQLNNHLYYEFVSIDKDDNNKNWYNANNINNNDSSFPGIMITYLDKDFHKDDAYINFIAKNEKHKVESGTKAIQLAIRLCKYLNVRDVYLQDDSKIQCEQSRDLSLALLKLLTTGNTWYEKHGFKLNVKNYKKIKSAIEDIQNMKMNDVVKIVKKIRDALQNTINSGNYKHFKLWTPFSSGNDSA